MDDLIESDPQYYRSKIYLPHPAPGYPGEPMTNRDETRYDGGTYLVHRKYNLDLEKWRADDFEIENAYGCPFRGDDARNQAIGRDKETSKVISGADGSLLEKEKDSTEANLAPLDSHIIQARGGSPAPFMGPFPPVEPGKANSFHLQDIRIRRLAVPTGKTAKRSPNAPLLAASYGDANEKGFVVHLWETVADRTVLNGSFSFMVLQ